MTEKSKTIKSKRKTIKYNKTKKNKTKKNKCIYTDEGIRITKLIKQIKRANNKKK